ncbi:hypothetical protein GEV33_003904 [Tenebrio molitor]|uniref:Uncharacterized protein n=1 Tax=Tenebrio molitor TaxID=7067 RepID=A0A8J6LH03_TENMO|nr:hypothetical protein GEV33_003904 [Tenebrio molitor]
MKTNTIIFVSVVIAAIQDNKAATITEAKTKLMELTELTAKHMGIANEEHTKMSNEIDAATLMSKQHGLAEIEKKCYKFLKKLEADKVRTRMCRGVRDNVIEHVKKSNTEELVQCINQQGKDSVNLVSKQKLELADYVWNAIAEEEKQIILCGHTATSTPRADLGCEPKSNRSHNNQPQIITSWGIAFTGDRINELLVFDFLVEVVRSALPLDDLLRHVTLLFKEEALVWLRLMETVAFPGETDRDQEKLLPITGCIARRLVPFLSRIRHDASILNNTWQQIAESIGSGTCRKVHTTRRPVRGTLFVAAVRNRNIYLVTVLPCRMLGCRADQGRETVTGLELSRKPFYPTPHRQGGRQYIEVGGHREGRIGVELTYLMVPVRHRFSRG